MKTDIEQIEELLDKIRPDIPSDDRKFIRDELCMKIDKYLNDREDRRKRL